MTHEVYIGRYQGDVMYIGEGLQGRHKHLNSGVSNIYEANMLHFSGERIEVEVVSVDDKCSAEELEVKLIKELNPPWNTYHTEVREKKALLRKIFRTKPPKLPVSSQHYLVGLLYYAKDHLNADNTLYVNSALHPDIIKPSCMRHLYHRQLSSDYLHVERTESNKIYKVTFDEEFFNEEYLWGLIRPKIKQEGYCDQR